MKLNKKLFLFIFFSIFIAGAFLRFYQLGNIPNSLNWDEVSWGYNAYSILETGKDEYGEAFPLSFKALGDYKQPLYVYASVIPIALFDLTPFATRFPSAFFGSLSILLVYFLTFELFRKEKHVRLLALLTMFFFAISPWAIQFSRVAYEATVGLFFILLGSWLFIRGLNIQQKWYFFIGTIALTLSAYTYHSDKLFAPALFLVLLLYGWKYFFNKKALAIGLIIVFVLCNLFWILDSRTTARGVGVLFTGRQTEVLGTPVSQAEYDKQQGDYFGALLHNWRIVYTQQYITNYLHHFNPNWLFMHGDNPRHHAPQVGLLYLTNAIFILLGIYYLLKNKPYVASLLLAWLFLAPAAAALAVEAPNASRSLVFLPTWHIFEAVGWWYAFSLIKNKRLRMLLVLPLLLLLFNIIYYLHQYFVHINTDDQEHWQYGYKEAVLASKDYKDKSVIYSEKFEQPYIFYLFHMKYDPAKYLASGGSARISEKCYTIENASFGVCRDKLKSGDIYIVVREATIENTLELKRFDYNNGKPAVRIFEYK